MSMSEFITVEKVDKSMGDQEFFQKIFTAFEPTNQALLYKMYCLDGGDILAPSILLNITQPDEDKFTLELAKNGKDLAGAIIGTLNMFVTLAKKN